MLLGGAPASRPSTAERWLAVALAVLAASTWLARSPGLAWRGEIEQREGLLTWLALAGLFVGALRTHHDRDARDRTLDTVVFAAALAAGYALVQFAGLDVIAWGDAARYTTGGASVLRPASTLGNPVLLGVVLAPALAIVTARLANGRGDRVMLSAVAAVFACALAATLSRGAWLASGAGMIVSLAVVRPGGRRAALALGAPLLPALAWTAVALRGAPLARLSEGAAASSGPARLAIAQAAVAMWRERPWLGSGPDGFGLEFPRVQPLSYWQHDWLGIPAHAHSAPLQLLATTGLLGLLALAVWAAVSLAPLARAVRDPVRAPDCAPECGAVAALAVASLFNTLGLAGSVVAIVLLALSASRRAWDPGAASPGRGRAVAALLIVGLAAGGASIHELRELALAGRVHALLEAGLSVPAGQRAAIYAEAAQAADQLVLLNPVEDASWRVASDARLAWSREAYSARVGGAAGIALAAEEAAREAIAREPRRASNRLRLASALAWRAQAQSPVSAPAAREVFAAFEEARRRAPADALVLVERARAEDGLGQPAAALETARRITALYPTSAQGPALEGLALLRMQRLAEAREALRRARDARWEGGSEVQRRAVEELLRELSAPATPRPEGAAETPR